MYFTLEANHFPEEVSAHFVTRDLPTSSGKLPPNQIQC